MATARLLTAAEVADMLRLPNTFATATGAWVSDEPATDESVVAPQCAATATTKRRKAKPPNARYGPQLQTERGAAGPPAAHANICGEQQQSLPPLGAGPRVAIPISDGPRLHDVIMGGMAAFIAQQQGERKIAPIPPRHVELLFQHNQYKVHGTEGSASRVESGNMHEMKESIRDGVHRACQGARERFAQVRTYAPLARTLYPRSAIRR